MNAITHTVELKKDHALRILEDLQALDAVSFKPAEEPERVTKPVEPSDFRGYISEETAQRLLQHIEQAREEWDRAV